MQVKTEVFSRLFVFEDVCQQAFVARSENNRMVWDIGILLFGAEIPNKQTIREVCLVDAAFSPLTLCCLRQEVFIRPCRVGVGNHKVGGNMLARLRSDTGNLSIFCSDLIDLSIEVNVAALTANEVA